MKLNTKGRYAVMAMADLASYKEKKNFLGLVKFNLFTDLIKNLIASMARLVSKQTSKGDTSAQQCNTP